MPRQTSVPEPSTPSGSPITPRARPQGCDCAYWRGLAVDTLLELAAAREQLAMIDEDQIELIAARCTTLYRAMGGRVITAAAWRARSREIVHQCTRPEGEQ